MHEKRKEITYDELKTVYIEPYLVHLDHELGHMSERRKEISVQIHKIGDPPADLGTVLTDLYKESSRAGRTARAGAKQTPLEAKARNFISEGTVSLSYSRNLATDVVRIAEENKWWNPFTLVAKCATPTAKFYLRIMDNRDVSAEKEIMKLDAALKDRGDILENSARESFEQFASISKAISQATLIPSFGSTNNTIPFTSQSLLRYL
jgi:hypothetical protein